ETSTPGCMPANTIRSFSSADHLRRLLMSFPPGFWSSLHPEEKVGYFSLCAIWAETLQWSAGCFEESSRPRKPYHNKCPTAFQSRTIDRWSKKNSFRCRIAAWPDDYQMTR